MDNFQSHIFAYAFLHYNINLNLLLKFTIFIKFQCKL